MIKAFFGYKNTAVGLITFVAVVLSAGQVCGGAQAIDSSRYITVDEVSTDMDAYCLTVLEGQKIEKFPLKILSIVKNYEPKRDAILVVGTDERFIKAGAIHGCSGSPVYIDGRMAGALAAGWDGSKEPLYLITPIAEMLDIGASGHANNDGVKTSSLGIDFSRPVELSQINDAVLSSNGLSKADAGNRDALYTSLPQEACAELSSWLRGMTIIPLAGGQTEGKSDAEPAEYEPGGVLSVPLVSGDITMASIGTVTEVIGNKVYGFGHNFLGVGPIDLPMAGGTVHTVIPGIMRASKFATPGPIKGAIRFDEAAGIYGLSDATAKTIPLVIRVDRFNDPQRRQYDCQLAVNELRTPLMIQSVIVGAISMRGPLPPDHTLRYGGKVDVDGYKPIAFSNISSGESYTEIAIEALSVASLLMNNPYGKVDIRHMEFDVDVEAKNTRAVIRTVNLSDSTVKAGDTLSISVLLQSYLSELSLHRIALPIPPDTPAGDYEITVAGSEDYEKFLRKVAVHKFTAYDLDSLVDALNLMVSIKRDRLYAVMSLPAGGVIIKRSELPDLPETKVLLMSDSKRTTTARKFEHWIEDRVEVGKVVLGSQDVKIKIER
jgi:hypothetical protein